VSYADEPRDVANRRGDDQAGEDYRREQREDGLADFTPLTLGERHAECLERIDAGLTRAEELCAELDAGIARLLPRERGLS
jgi:hypothetical protein